MATQQPTEIELKNLTALGTAANCNGGYKLRVGTVLVIKGAATKSDNGRFVVVANYHDKNLYWKRVKRNNEWTAGGNVARNFRGMNMAQYQELSAQGIITQAGEVDAEYARDCH